MRRYLVCVLALFLFACSTTQTPSPLANNPPVMTLTPTIDTIRFPPPTSTVFVTTTPTLIPPSPTSTTEEQNIDQTEVPVFALPTLQAGRLIQLASIHMIDAQVGWGIYEDSQKVLRPGSQGDPYLYRPEGYIVRTTDGGKTWQNVTPPSGAYSAGGFFALDANMAWANSNVPCCFNHNTTQLWRTTNGGKTWEASQPFSIKIKGEESGEFYIPIQIQFIDPNTGWLLSSSRIGMGNRLRTILLHTTDGGGTWTDMEFGVNGFMVNCWNGGLAFINSTTGWYGTSCVGSPRVFHFNDMFGEGGWKILKTTDGGNSFTDSTLIPTPPDLQELAVSNPEMDCGERRVEAFASNVLGVEWNCRNYDTHQDYQYFSLSTDEGATWTTWTPSGNEYFLNAQHGWRLLPTGELQQTDLLGSGWVTIKKVSWKSAQFDFVNQFEGWALVFNGNETSLVHTIDGGLIWDEIKPVIAP